MRILVADDDLELSGLVAFALRQGGFTVAEAPDGLAALAAVRASPPDLVILDVNMPRLSGFEVLERLRAFSRVPVLMLTVRAGEDDQVRGLDLGADDYLPKPFSPPELVLRVGAVLRRLAAPAIASGGLLAAGSIALDKTAHQATVNGREIELTATEFRLLRTLMERQGRVQSRAQLLELVWQAQPDIQTRTVDMHVQRLRQKLGSAGDAIETVRGAGYRFKAPPTGRKRA